MIKSWLARIPISRADIINKGPKKPLKLRAPPNSLRCAYVFQVIIAVGVFIITYFYAATIPLIETITSDEALDGPWICRVMSPRSDSEILNDTSSRLVAFSDARYDSKQCFNALGNTGTKESYDVCSYKHTSHNVVSVTGLSSNNTNCQDLYLSSNFRFCSGNKDDIFQSENPAVSNAFPLSASSETSSSTSVSQFYFVTGASSSSSYHFIELFPTFSSFLSPFISNYQNKVFIIILKEEDDLSSFLYQFDLVTSTPTELMEIPSIAIYGVTYSDNTLFIASLDKTTGMGTIHSYNLVSEVSASLATNLDCSSSLDKLDDPDSSHSYLSYGLNDKKLYLMCTSQIGSGSSDLFDFYQVDPLVSGGNPMKLSVDFSSVVYSNEKGIIISPFPYLENSISQLFQTNNYLYFIIPGITSASSTSSAVTSPVLFLLQVNLTSNDLSSLPFITSISNKGAIETTTTGSSVTNTLTLALPSENQQFIYFTKNNEKKYFNIVLQKFAKNFTTIDTTSYFTANSIQLGYSYQLCNSKITRFPVNYDDPSSFANQCGKRNG
jgi:hypothetical protein